MNILANPILLSNFPVKPMDQVVTWRDGLTADRLLGCKPSSVPYYAILDLTWFLCTSVSSAEADR